MAWGLCQPVPPVSGSAHFTPSGRGCSQQTCASWIGVWRWAGEGRQGRTASLPQRLPLEGPGSFKERLGVRAACMGSCDQLWLPGVGAQVHSRRKTAGVGVRCVPHPSPTWSSSSTPAPSSPCASLGGPCFLGVLAHSHCHGTYNSHLFLTVWRLDVRDLGTGRWFLLRPLSLVC